MGSEDSATIEDAEARDDEASPAAPSFLIVGIGASAGGLEALTELLKAVTKDSMAFVVVQHLAPDHESLLPEILSRSTSLPVHPITDGMRVECNHVYVAPPRAEVAILHGVLHLMSPPAILPIDRFFRSLAEDQGTRAIGVVLSGMGTDGTQGLKEIKARGGLAFCQDPATAKYDSMPQSALASGVVDRSLAPAALAAELLALTQHPYLARALVPPPPSEREELAKLFIILRSAFGNDLSLYKPSTISRRIARRMALQKIEQLPEYVRFVQGDHDEQRALYQDVLISVTSFFRDVEPFEVLKRLILPRILERKPAGSIRFWVPACASGEEAYSLGICLLEALDESAVRYNVRIFGTDVDEEAIARARRAIYPPNIEADVSSERLRRFFVKVGADYQVSRRLRDLLVFSPQNVGKDAPFSRVDLVSCRNLLIYLQPQLQKRVLRLLHYALAPDGYLVLGTSETVGDCADLFSLVDRKNKIYVKKNLPQPVLPDDRQLVGVGADAPIGADVAAGERRPGLTAEQLADRKLLDRYGPPSVLINENFDVLQFRGDTGDFLAPASGAATLNLLKLLRPELHVEVWRGIQQSLKDNAPVRVGPIRLTRDGRADRNVGVEIVPIHEVETRSRSLLVVFDDGAATPPSTDASQPDMTTDKSTRARVRELEQGLAATREYLQATIEELETSNEELKSTNEELQSSNEELQSSNEELETSKEELQATNEELSTMNTELVHKMEDLARSTTDLDNLMLNVEQPVLFVDGGLRVRRATDAAQRLLELAPGDLGRPIAQLKGLFVGTDVGKMVETTLSRLVATAEEVLVTDRWYEVRVVPYRSPAGVVDGALVILKDIDADRRRRDLVLDVKTYGDRVLAAVPHPLVIVDRQLRVMWVNPPFLEAFDVDVHATLGNLIQNLGSGQWAHPKLRAAMEAAFDSGQTFRDFRIEHDFENIGPRVVLVSGNLVTGIAGVDRVLLLSMVVTERAAGALDAEGRAEK